MPGADIVPETITVGELRELLAKQQQDQKALAAANGQATSISAHLHVFNDSFAVPMRTYDASTWLCLKLLKCGTPAFSLPPCMARQMRRKCLDLASWHVC